MNLVLYIHIYSQESIKTASTSGISVKDNLLKVIVLFFDINFTSLPLFLQNIWNIKYFSVVKIWKNDSFHVCGAKEYNSAFLKM